MSIQVKAATVAEKAEHHIEGSQASYVGSEICAGCHQAESKKWQGSHHDMAMRHAKPDAVKGDFDNVEFGFNNEINKFFRKGDAYWVNIKGADGKFSDYQIKYTFGVYPLQQYMVEFDDGRIQLIPYAWDDREASQGGQRWFHLYPEFTDSRDEFFWTNTGQNWNYMCADCHSTNVKKNFDLATNTYNTTFSEINVGCEACHGPASVHLNFVKNSEDKSQGFNRNLSKPVNQWVKRAGKNTLFPEEIVPTQQLLVCAQCHSRHVQISDNNHVDGNAFGERYMLSLINSNQYHADGQIYDEVFVFGSFVQSKMSQNGVACTNCHDPHSNELIIPKEALCLQCHTATTYAATSHHQHQENSEGAQCVNCHMPETTYMQVDERRDHAWHVPRSDLAEKLGTPDTCLNCHSEKDSSWSASLLKSWYPDSPTQSQEHFAPVFSAIDNGYLQASQALSHVAQNKANTPIIRASALERMSPLSDKNSLIAIARGARDPNEFVRLGAARGADSIALNERWRILAPLLKDKVLSVRVEAAYSLLLLWPQLTDEQKELMQPALDEYISVQEFNNDRGFSHNNIGTVYANQGLWEKAETAFKTSIRLEPNFAQAYVNLSETYRRSNQDEAKSIAVLNQGKNAAYNNAQIPYSLGLSYLRKGQTNDAIDNLKLATQRAPNNGQYHYVLGLMLEKFDVNEAQRSLSKAYQVSQNPRHLYALCDMQVKYAKNRASKCIEQLSEVAPPEVVEQLKVQLSNANK